MFSCIVQDLQDLRLLSWETRGLGFYRGWDSVHSWGSGSAAGWTERSRLQIVGTAACGPESSERDGSPPGKRASPLI